MTEFSAVSLRIQTVGDKEAFAALDALDRKGRKIVDDAAGAMGRAMGDVAVAYERGGAKMRAALEDVAIGHRENIKQLEAEAAAANTYSAGSVAGLGRIRQGMTSLVAQMTGTMPVLDRVLAAFGSMGVGTLPMVGALAGIAAAAEAYRFLTRDARAAEAAQKAALEALLKWDKQRHMDAGGAFGEEVSGATAQTARDSSTRSRLGRAAGAVFGTGGLGTAIGGAIGVYLENTKKGFEQARLAVREGQAALGEEITRGFLETRARDAATLAENIKSNNATHAERLRAIEMLRQDRALMAQYKRGGVSGDLRSMLGSEIEGLDSALNPEDKDGERAARQAAAAAKRAAQVYREQLAHDLTEAKKLGVKQGVDDAETTYGAQHSILSELVPTKKQIDAAMKQAGENISRALENDPVIAFEKAVKEMAKRMKEELARTLGDALSAGFEAAFTGKGITGAFEALTATVLAGLGGFMEQLGAQMVIVGVSLETLADALLSLDGAGAIAAGVALIAAGAGLKAIAGSFGKGHGSSSYGGGYSPSAGPANIIDRGVINSDAYTSTKASSVQPRPMIVNHNTIFGTNDATAQRGFDEMMRKSLQRGSLVPT